MEIIKKIKIIIFLIIILGFIILNKEIMPARKELTELELVKAIGMDILDEEKYKVEETVLRVPIGSGASSSNGDNKSNTENGQKAKIFSTKGISFSDAIRTFQTYVNKTMSGAHIKVMILGEDLCKQDMVKYLDFNYRDYEVRLNCSVYISKGTTAKDFINDTANNEFSVDEKVLSMEKNNEAKGVSYTTSITNLMSMLSKDDACGLLPTLELISEKEGTQEVSDEKETQNPQDFQTAALETEKKTQSYFDFGGFAIIKDRKLAGYLNRENSTTCNLLKNQLKGANINIDLGDDNLLSFGVFSSITGYTFKFEGDKLSEVKIKNGLKVNYEEVRTENDIYSYEKIQEYEKKISEQIKSEIYEVIDLMKKYDCDFINMNDFCKIKHPYKFEKIKDNWVEQLLNAEFEVEVDTQILRTYDLLQVK